MVLEKHVIKEKEETEQKKDIKEYLMKIYMSVLPHHRQIIKPGHPCQPPIKHFIYNSERKDIKHLLKALESIKELSNVMGEYGTKELLFLMSQDNAKSEDILKNAIIYKKDRNLEEFNYNSKKNKLKKINSF